MVAVREQYPQRPNGFAAAFVKMLSHAEVANDIGPNACWLLTTVVMEEERHRYAGPARMWLATATQRCGIPAWSTFRRLRLKCIERGWLAYEEPTGPNATNQSVAAIDFPSQTRIDGNSIALVC